VNGHHHSHHNEYDALYGGPLYVGGRHSASPPPSAQQLSSADANAAHQLATLTAFSASSVASPMDYSVAGLKWNEMAKLGNFPLSANALAPPSYEVYRYSNAHYYTGIGAAQSVPYAAMAPTNYLGNYPI